MFANGGGIASSGNYQITNSVRLRAAAGAYFSRTFGSPTDNKKWTISMWVKRGKLSTAMTLFGSGDGTANNYFDFTYQAADTVFVQDRVGAVNKLATNPSATLNERDPTGHIHVVFTFDSSNATAANRNLLYFNNQNFPLAANLASGDASSWNVSGYTHVIGASDSLPGIYNYWDGLISEVVFIDGQALTPSSFGTTDINGVWVPKAYTGTYGNNGFYLNFKDANLTAGSNVGLGKDVSGNGNYWNTTGISVTPGVNYDAMVDTPTNNYATLNPLNAYPTDTNSANLRLTSSLSNWQSAGGTLAVSSGKWYWEVVVGTTAGSGNVIGIAPTSQNLLPAAVYTGLAATGYGYYSFNGNKYNNGASTAYGATYTVNDVIGVALDMSAGTLTFYKNNTTQGQMASGLTGDYCPSLSVYDAGNYLDANFGQRPFTYTPPTGFKALCTANLPAVAIPNPRKHFDVVTRAGTSAAATVSSLSVQPDFIWIKSRTLGAGGDHVLIDSVRGAGSGATKELYSDLTNAESGSTNVITAFSSNGYSLGTDASYLRFNATSNTYVDWLWKAGGNANTFNKDGVGYASMAAAGLTDGSIAATGISVNTVAGFSIVTYTGTGANATVGHGLGVAPKMVIVKRRTTAGADWQVWHTALAGTEIIYLDTTSGKSTDATKWNSTIPSSTVISLGTSTGTNSNTDTFVAYCFAEIPGYSKFGSYVGNGAADGPFVYCGFRPKYVMVRNVSGVVDWIVFDAARDTYNQMTATLYPDLATAEGAVQQIDFTASGFKIRSTSGYANGSTNTHIFAAFAEFPFGGSNVSPSPAR